MSTDYTFVPPEETPKSVKAPKPAAKPSVKPAGPSIGERVKQFGIGAAEKAGELGIRGGMALGQLSMYPVEGLTNVLSTPMRVSQATMGHKELLTPGLPQAGIAGGMGPLGALVSPKQRELAGHQIYAMFHPNDPRIQDLAEEKSGISRLTTTGDIGKKLPEAVAKMYGSSDPERRARGVALSNAIQDFVVHTGGQVAMDPLTYAGGPIAELGGAALRGYDDVVTKALTGELGKGAQRTAKTFTPTRGRITSEGRVFDANQRGEIQTLVNKYDVRARRATDDDTKFLKSVKSQVPKNMAWAQLPDFVRETLASRGIHAEAALAGEAGEPVLKRISATLAQKRNEAYSGDLERELYANPRLGLKPKEASEIAKIDETGGSHPVVQAMRWVSGAKTKAMLYTGIPHMRNVGMAGYMAGGSKLIKRAVEFQHGGVPAYLREKLEQGGLAHFGHGAMGQTLQDWDDAVRAARLEQIEKLPEYAELPLGVKLDRVNDDIGAYSKKTRLGQYSSNVGGQFPQWHGYISPTLGARAILRTPGRVARMGRAEENISEQLPGGQTVEFGGPLTESAEALAFPFGTAKYAASPSMTGVVIPAIQALGKAGPSMGKSPAADIRAGVGLAKEVASWWGPSKLASDILDDVTHGQLPGMSMTGVYMKKKGPQASIRAYLDAQAKTKATSQDYTFTPP